MKLVSFSVKNYRSIVDAKKIPLSGYSVLIGANNEGKSNILHALALAMGALERWQFETMTTADGKIVRIRSSNRYSNSYPFSGSASFGYQWKTDFPLHKQNTSGKEAVTKIDLEFSLNDTEISEFRQEIKSNLNGTLPISLSFGRTNDLEVSVLKPGKGKATLEKKATRIANFVSKRIRFEYIPAIRNSQSAEAVITRLVERQLRVLEADDEYKKALETIEQLQAPLFASLGLTVQDTVSQFLPSVTEVKLMPRRDARYRALRAEVDIVVNDGHETKLERKGDGVQSLVALALMRHASMQQSNTASSIIAIEEPESHLHPSAIHELRGVIQELSQSNQVVLTSHSPLFVNPSRLDNTVIVKGSRARCAVKISEVRDTLGVKFSDNLQSASLVLIGEGENDIRAMRSILPSLSEKISKAVESGVINFDFMGGVGGLAYKASFYKSGACQIQCLIDNDDEGRAAVDKAIAAKALKLIDVNLCIVPGLEESELEDLYNINVYKDAFIEEWGVDPGSKLISSKKMKWSAAMSARFKQAGKPWDDRIKSHVKEWLSGFAENHPTEIIRGELSGPLDNFIMSVESKITYVLN